MIKKIEQWILSGTKTKIKQIKKITFRLFLPSIQIVDTERVICYNMPMPKNNIDINSIDITKATTDQITRANKVISLPWSKRLFDGKLSYEEALRHIIYHDMTKVMTIATEGNITPLFGLPHRPR